MDVSYIQNLYQLQCNNLSCLLHEMITLNLKLKNKHGGLLSNGVRMAKGMCDSDLCLMCGVAAESPMHQHRYLVSKPLEDKTETNTIGDIIEFNLDTMSTVKIFRVLLVNQLKITQSIYRSQQN